MRRAARTQPLFFLLLQDILGAGSQRDASNTKLPPRAGYSCPPLLPVPIEADDSRLGRPAPPTYLDPPGNRVVAIGDLHGDWAATVSALQVAGAIDNQLHWVGGDMVIVQLGDQLDRGDSDRAIVDLFECLAVHAHYSGGGVFSILGNHELMNVVGEFQYTSNQSFKSFADLHAERPDTEDCSPDLGTDRRRAAFRPGGSYARKLSNYRVAMVVGDTLFVHAGLLPSAAVYGLDRLNFETAAWLNGSSPHMPALLDPGNAANPVWSRFFTDPEQQLWPKNLEAVRLAIGDGGGGSSGGGEVVVGQEAEEEGELKVCSILSDTLRLSGASRMVVGHSPQLDGIQAACGRRLWNVDIGLSSAIFGSQPAVLELTMVKAAPPVLPVAPRKERQAVAPVEAQWRSEARVLEWVVEPHLRALPATRPLSARQVFLAADRDKNGVLSPSEFRQHLLPSLCAKGPWRPGASSGDDRGPLEPGHDCRGECSDKAVLAPMSRQQQQQHQQHQQHEKLQQRSDSSRLVRDKLERLWPAVGAARIGLAALDTNDSGFVDYKEVETALKGQIDTSGGCCCCRLKLLDTACVAVAIQEREHRAP